MHNAKSHAYSPRPFKSTGDQTAAQAAAQNAAKSAAQTAAQAAGPSRPLGHRELPNPLSYSHAFESMARYAQLLALRYDCNRTRHAYYRQLGLLQRHFDCDPQSLTQDQLREYLLFLKFDKRWKSNTMRQAVACFRTFFHELLQRGPWEVFSQIRTRDHDTLPVVLTREQVRRLLGQIRLRRYRIPIKLIYCCGLRLSECLSLTVHDIKGSENMLLIRQGKGLKD